MHRATLALAMAALTLTTPAQAQRQALSDGIRFTLRPRPIALTQGLDPAERARISPLVPVAADDRAHELAVMVRRQTLRQRAQHRPAPSMLNPRSRFVLISAEDRVPVGDRIMVIAGFQGMKLTNRDANVTAIGGSERLRTRDWFMPHATVEIAPVPAVALAIGYRETLHAYGDTGVTGAMGLSREAFRSLAEQLRPERQARLRFDGKWTPARDLSLAITAFEGRIDDRLSFAGRNYLPSNSGSAKLQGARMALTQRLSPHWRWSMGYGEAHVREQGGGRAKESSLTIETGWTSGRWSATLQGTKNSVPALRADADRWRPRIHVEGELRYQLSGVAGKPASISVRLTDPVPLASAALLNNGPAGPARAAEQARGLMLGVGLGW